MSHSSSIDLNNIVRRVSESDAVSLSWGRLVWLIGEKETPGAEQTLGVVTIEPGKRNPLHFHPNCEELLYVMEGEADHKLGDEMFHITTGDVIRIPQGVPHWAQAKGETPLVALISFSAADRKTENLEDTGDIA
ncbi:MAG: cupin domain-containing protein [Chloroflexota bacterium]|jgi:quercetin dioxygenase-like cupin family protein|uniref:cupin domain-containing protein n=1 Tax=Ornithinimicrobium sp. TaxID=1977084 RepID=UPI0027CB65E2|nr:cupin domain-containing protein [Chloroflexota bacterium]